MSPVRLGLLRCAVAAALFGATTPLAARLAHDTSAPMLAGLLYLGAGAAVAPFAARQRDLAAAARTWRPLAVAVVAGGFLGPLLLTAGLARTPGATASLLLNLELVATVVVAAIFFREHIGRRVATGSLLVLAAGAVLAWSGTPDLRVGAALIVGACVCWGVDNGVTASIDRVSPEFVTLAKGVIAGTTNVGVGVALGGRVPPAATIAGALALGAVGYGASIALWIRGARDLGAARGQLVFSLAPFVGVVVAWSVLGDPLRVAELAAVVLAAGGVALVLRSDHEHPHRHPSTDHDHDHVHDDGHHDHPHADADSAARHSHPHTHEPVTHAHRHVPDLHHRHDH